MVDIKSISAKIAIGSLLDKLYFVLQRLSKNIKLNCNGCS